MNTFLTRERLLEIIVTGPDASGAEQNELARIALTAQDSEPVIVVGDDGGLMTMALIVRAGIAAEWIVGGVCK